MCLLKYVNALNYEQHFLIFLISIRIKSNRIIGWFTVIVGKVVPVLN
jgi:hypothetical protein